MIPVFPFLKDIEAGSGFLLGTPGATLRLDSEAGIQGDWPWAASDTMVFSLDGQDAVVRDL